MTVELQNITHRVLSRYIVRVYGLDAIEGNEYVIEAVSKEQVSFRLP